MEELRVKGTGEIVNALPLLSEGFKEAVRAGAPLEKLFGGLADEMKNATASQRSFIANSFLGSTGLVGLLSGGREGIGALRSTARSLGASVSQEQAKRAVELQTSLNAATATLGAAFDNVSRLLVKTFAPALTFVLDTFTESILGPKQNDLGTSAGISADIRRLKELKGSVLGSPVGFRPSAVDRRIKLLEIQLAMKREQELDKAPFIGPVPPRGKVLGSFPFTFPTLEQRRDKFLGPGGAPAHPFAGNRGINEGGGPFGGNIFESGFVGIKKMDDALSEATIRAQSFGDTLSYGIENAIFQARTFEDALRSIGLQMARFFFQETAGAAISGLGASLFSGTIGKLPVFGGGGGDAGFRSSSRQQTNTIQRAFG